MLNRFFQAGVLWVALAVGACALAQTPAGPDAGRRVDLQGHRGARWLWPENTLAGFRQALTLGVTTLELDVVMTRDDVLVISHDVALNPSITRDAQGRFLPSAGPARPLIRSLTSAQLQAFDVGRIDAASAYGRSFPAQQPVDGEKIPRLSDLFALVKGGGHEDVRLAIEIKVSPWRPEATPGPEQLAEALVRDIKAHGMAGRVQILSFDWRVLRHVQQLDQALPTVYLTAQLPELDNLLIGSEAGSPWTAGFQYRTHGSVPKMVRAAGGTHWSSHWRELDAAQVREAQALGLQVLAWTVNDRRAMHQMLDFGVDGLVTDRPDLAAAVLRERGLDSSRRR